jgi:hypothetical protein
VSEREDEQGRPEVEGHIFRALDGVFDDDESIGAEDTETDDDSPDVQPHGMSGFG